MLSRRFLCVATLVALVLAAGCAPSANAVAGGDGDLPGFWKGLWHGFILLFTFVVSLFDDNVGVYEIRNGGHLYDLGFLLGIMAFFGGGCGGASKKKRK